MVWVVSYVFVCSGGRLGGWLGPFAAGKEQRRKEVTVLF